MQRIAIPTDTPGGLEAKGSEHFGHCDTYTIVDLTPERSVAKITVITNGGHEAGGCLSPVKTLAEAGVEAIIVGGVGARPMQGLMSAGIGVYYAGPAMASPAASLLERFLAGGLPVMHGNQACQGSGNCQH